jgi:hypothetical protein
MGLKLQLFIMGAMIARLPKSVGFIKLHERAYTRSFILLVAPTQIRTGVLALKGLRPGPLDDEGTQSFASIPNKMSLVG